MAMDWAADNACQWYVDHMTSLACLRLHIRQDSETSDEHCDIIGPVCAEDDSFECAQSIACQTKGNNNVA